MEAQREKAESFLLDGKIESLKEYLEESETESLIKEIYREILKEPVNELEVLEVLNKYNEYLGFVIYADFLLKKEKVEESVDFYKKALFITKTGKNSAPILKTLAFVYLQLKDLENAFETAWTLIELDTSLYNLRLLKNISILIKKSKMETILIKKAEKTEKFITDKIKTETKKTETTKINDLEIIGAPGLGEFLKDHQIDLNRNFDSGFLDESESKPFFHLLEENNYEQFLEESIKRIPDKEITGMPEKDLFSYLIKTEDILTLYKLAEYLYRNNYYLSSSIIYYSVIELFSRIYTQRLKFLQLAVTMNSAEFFNIYEISPLFYKKFKESVKRFNLSIFIIKKEKQKEHTLDKILTEHFKEKIYTEFYNIPEIYKK